MSNSAIWLYRFPVIPNASSKGVKQKMVSRITGTECCVLFKSPSVPSWAMAVSKAALEMSIRSAVEVMRVEF